MTIKRRLPLVVIAVCLFAIATHAQTRQPESLTAGLAELNKGNVFEAIRLFKQIVRAEPYAAAPSFYLSGIYAGMGRYGVAYRYLETAMNQNSVKGAYYHQLGLIRRYEGCRPEALDAFQKALVAGMGKDEAVVLRQIGELQVDLLEFDQAMATYRTALSLRPVEPANSAAAHLALGRLYLDRNDPQHAIPELRAALEVVPPPGVHASLGRAYRATGDLESAASILQKGVDRNPSDQESLYMLGQVFLTQGKENEGRQAMEEYQKVQDRLSRTNTLFETAIERAQSGDLNRAEALLKDALKIAPRSAPVLQALGTVMLNRGNTRGALGMLKQAQASNPLNPETYFNMGTAYFRSGKLPEALDMTERALVLDDEDPRYETLLGEIDSKMNRAAESQAALQRSAELRSRPGYRTADAYSSEMRHRDETATVKQICGYDAER